MISLTSNRTIINMDNATTRIIKHHNNNCWNIIYISLQKSYQNQNFPNLTSREPRIFQCYCYKNAYLSVKKNRPICKTHGVDGIFNTNGSILYCNVCEILYTIYKKIIYVTRAKASTRNIVLVFRHM
jgi:hypothetical protein